MTDLEKFKAMIKPYRFATQFFSEKDASPTFDITGIKEFLKVCSSGEKILLQFFCTVWSQDNSFDFDILEAAGSLDGDHKKVVASWLQNPFWP